MSPLESASSRQRLGIILMLAGSLVLAVNDAATKWLTEGYPVGQIVFLRGCVAALIIVAVEFFRSNPSALLPHDLKGQFSRAILFAFSTVLLTVSLKFLPLAVVTAILFISPILITLLAGPLLKERVEWRVWLAAGIGFGGIFLIAAPVGTSWTWAFFIPLGSALCSALRDITTRHLALTESTSSIVLMTALVSAAVGLVTLPSGDWLWPQLLDGGLFLFLGVAQLGAHYLQVEAFRLARASVLAPLKYSMVLWAIVLGILLWGDIPDLAVLIGATLVIAAGLLVYQSKASTT